MRRPFARVVAIALLMLPSTAMAVDWLGARLPNGPGEPWPYYVDARKAVVGGIDRLVVESTFQTAFQLWDDVGCSFLDMTYQGPDNLHALEQPDGFNVVGVFIERRADDPEFYDNALGGGAAIAAATPLYYGGTIYECDLGLNAVDYTFSPTGEGVFDLQSVANHEAGHCLGLDHTGDPTSAMYATLGVGELRRGLSQTDVTNLCSLYPKTGQVGSPCDQVPCAQGMTCIGIGPTAYCSKGCDPEEPNVCDVGFSCIESTKIPGSPGHCTFGGASSIKVGAPCAYGSVHQDCGAPVDAMCLPYDSVLNIWRDGYCTVDCTDYSCPASSHCYELSDGAGGSALRCLKDCRPGQGDCRFDYACQPVSSGLGRCQPSCHHDSECETGQCRACDGLCIHPSGGKQVGDSCTDDAECPAGGACRRDITEGTCVIACGTSCSVCPQGSSCMEYEGEMLCFKACERGSDCMFGQGCWYEGSVTGCKPVCETHEDCPVGTVCTLGSCLRRAGRDAGCSLCDDRDAAQPPGTDAAQPLPPPPSGCGCGVQGGAGTATGILAAALLGAALRRRTRCRT